mmetsp:Transcript_20900/g.27483  ORF Transcript_20900/g.27483 Transcript_20900/m.27483 type:complete len:374 (+) Transcript_20900:110-1231(+)|eukprot:CAMPEP_0195282890 /NCGR_PEP_ID=MMETSP0707-20130614/1615_1 /TAXON_ID=33640 /ORGANISM="Asterionellopsis glacialis, Strain CCMP134" /LENGTH=373 /DNA_ID=CAMNT_0040341959 /DNA_START=61 /DNA_END=1182 /DNA_ORIENTATION=+
MASNQFESTSTEKPSLLEISFAKDPSGSMGAQLNNLDKGTTAEMFIPGYASVGRLVDGETVARSCGVSVGDCIVAINGEGFRRFPPDFDDNDLDKLTEEMEGVTLGADAKKLKGKVLTNKTGENYPALLNKIKEIKKSADPENPLVIALERYGWDARVNSWGRFLAAREGNVPDAMQMIQDHESWKESTFPIDLSTVGLQDILKLKAVSEVDVAKEDLPPTVYVNYAKLQTLEADHSPDDVVKAFVIFTEIMLATARDPRHPKASQLIDLSGVSITSGFRVDILKKIYATFEPNYPETLSKMVMYPVSKVVASTSSMLLSFVNESTQKKFVITDSIEKVCEELGWDQKEVEACGGVTEFVSKHEKAGDSLISS